MQVREYLDNRERSPFRKWANALDAMARVKVFAEVARLELGSFTNVQSVGGGVLERKIDFGPGLRIYFALDGQRIVLLLGGSTKRRQSQVIKLAQGAWLDYKRRKKRGEKRLWH